ncbi:hypothetical protein FRC06_001883 [Ceratobasidium sp. 370]|nr:hypothetical protein FRC06_001883 [Ceratobasidium sp. 370]
MSIDDEDVHQVLPYDVSYYEAGVKNLNLRIRHQHPDVNDIRELLQFQQLEQLITSFRLYSNPVPQRYN